MMKLWIYENHMWELRGEELYEEDHRSYRRNFFFNDIQTVYFGIGYVNQGV